MIQKQARDYCQTISTALRILPLLYIFSMKILSIIIDMLVLVGTLAIAQPTQRVLYKQLDTTALYLDIYYPANYDTVQSYPAIVFFFGGGWKVGDVTQFEPHAAYLSDRGMVCILADYRTASRHQTSPFESLKDAKSAMRFVRKHAKEYHLDTAKIAAAGGSAGGHLASATAFIEGYNETSDDLSVRCKPNALVLFNPVIDNGPGGYGYERIGDAYKEFSPLHNITAGAPPTLFLLGTEDDLIPVETARYYQKVMDRVGSRCDLALFEGEKHGFFNYRNLVNYQKTVFVMDTFLVSLDYLRGTPTVEVNR